MSLTATLLHNQPITLPKGRRRTHYIEKPAVRQVASKPWVDRGTSAKNVERAFAAIRAGSLTVSDIHHATGLGKSTVQRAVTQLEEWPEGPRIDRDRSKRPHKFSPRHA